MNEVIVKSLTMLLSYWKYLRAATRKLRVKSMTLGQAQVAQACHPSYSGGSQFEASRDPITKKGWWSSSSPSTTKKSVTSGV
jgi:hypothetical protein